MRPSLLSAICSILLLAYVLRAGLAIFCFNCESEISWADCDLRLNETERTCSGPDDTRCLAVMERKSPRDKTKYIKKCTTRLFNPCDDKRKEECQATLCDTDLCNFALRPQSTLIAAEFRCYKCDSITSWEDCDQNAVEVICGAGYRKCFKLEFQKSGITEYYKGCTVPLACGDSAELMPNADDRDILCCGQILCNRAGIHTAYFGALFLVSMISVFTL